MAKKENISKKTWSKPELRVLCRGESEENVLVACKIGGHHGPDSKNCMYRHGWVWHGNKVPCHARTTS